MVNAWVEHVKKWSKENGMSYASAIGNKACKEEYYILKGEKPVKTKASNAKAPKSKSENKHAGEPDGNSERDIKHNGRPDGYKADTSKEMAKELDKIESRVKAISLDYLQLLKEEIADLEKQIDKTSSKKEARRLGKLIEDKRAMYVAESNKYKNLK